jgi:hypothetical protein
MYVDIMYAETMDPTLDRDYEGEALLGEIIRGGDDEVLSLLNYVEEELERDDDGSGHRMPGEEGDHDDGSGHRMPEEEGDHDDGSGDRTEGAVAKSSGEVYILIKPVLTN